MKKVFSFIVQDNKLILDDKQGFNQAVIALNGEKGKLTIAKYKKVRSLSANALYWKWMTILGEYIGHSKEDMHQVFKKQFLADKMPALSKDVFMAYLASQNIIDSTTELNTKEMTEYMDKIQAQARELRVQLPLPEDRFYEDM